MGFEGCWLKVGLALKISRAKVPNRTVHETLSRSLMADLRFIQLQGQHGRATTTGIVKPSFKRLPRQPMSPLLPCPADSGGDKQQAAALALGFSLPSSGRKVLGAD